MTDEVTCAKCAKAEEEAEAQRAYVKLRDELALIRSETSALHDEEMETQ